MVSFTRTQNLKELWAKGRLSSVEVQRLALNAAKQGCEGMAKMARIGNFGANPQNLHRGLCALFSEPVGSPGAQLCQGGPPGFFRIVTVSVSPNTSHMARRRAVASSTVPSKTFAGIPPIQRSRPLRSLCSAASRPARGELAKALSPPPLR